LGPVRILLRRWRISILTRWFLFLAPRRRRTGIVRRESLAAAELKVGYFCNVEGVYAITHRHPDLASVAAQILAVHHASAAERERIGGTNGRNSDYKSSNPK
jgi:hypothetical protein